MIKPSVDYRQFRFSRLNTPEFSHVWLLLYWPIFGLGFSYVERFYPVAHYINMHCALDDLIPFNEWFLIPYMFWFVYLIGAVAYTFFFDVPGFRRMMRFVMITYSVTLIIYFLFPTCQMLRPEVFPRDNALTRFIAGFYAFARHAAAEEIARERRGRDKVAVERAVLHWANRCSPWR